MSDDASAKRRVLVVGATGLIGRSVIERTPGMPEVILQGLARREMAFPEGARMELVLAQPEDWGGVVEDLAPDAVICALGTTRSKAGSGEAMRAVDYELVMHVARAAKEAGTRSFVHISSVGADTASRTLYLRTKGEVERDLKSLRFTRLDVLRPGLLRGWRQNDLRPLEGIGRALAPVTDLLLHGNATKYRSISGHIVAAAALQCTAEKAGGQFVHEHDAIKRLANRFEGAHE
ncbi:NAD-dependent epimerase/dehydratase family protein [Erythrobacter alti]|uniref:NAD-dependent epimerase/dehydratase family protein n=1 Tax=Erythrobacter alti TaxID=1896145 RepID=UPI0030F3F5A7